MKLNHKQLEYLANLELRPADPFKEVIEPIFIDGEPTEYKKTFKVFESDRGDRLILRTE